MDSPETLFSGENKQKILEAIRQAELNTSGEIRLHVESRCRIDVLDQAAYIFKKLEMHQTKDRNGVLFYLALKDKKFAVLGDAGINASVPANFWDEVISLITSYFKDNQFVEGLAKGIELAGQQLKEHFPYQSDDKNELSDEISIGK